VVEVPRLGDDTQVYLPKLDACLLLILLSSASTLSSWRSREGDRYRRSSRVGVSDSCLRDWIAQAHAKAVDSEPLSRNDRKELAELRRRNRRLEAENEILKQTVVFFARDSTLPT
jgi:hypothetical protein